MHGGGGLNKIAWHCRDRFYWDQADQTVTLSVSISRLTNSQRWGNDAMIEITPYTQRVFKFYHGDW